MLKYIYKKQRAQRDRWSYSIGRVPTKVNYLYNRSNIMINLLPQCTKCSSSVTDSIEAEIEHHGKVKMGNYTHGVWICNDCLAANKRDENKSEDEEKSSSPSTNHDNNKISNHSIGVASKSDVSPNTPRADEAGL